MVDFVILVVHQIEVNYGNAELITELALRLGNQHPIRSPEIYEEPLTELCHRTQSFDSWLRFTMMKIIQFFDIDSFSPSHNQCGNSITWFL